MARQETDREDLLREATALVERIEWDRKGQPVVAGFRRTGGLSVYFGGDPVLQFNARGELRRAFIDGRIFKAEAGRLVALTRHRAEGAVSLVRDELSTDRQARQIEAIRDLLSDLIKDMRESRLEVVGRIPAEADVGGRVDIAISAILATPITIAMSPRA